MSSLYSNDDYYKDTNYAYVLMRRRLRRVSSVLFLAFFQLLLVDLQSKSTPVSESVTDSLRVYQACELVSCQQSTPESHVVSELA